MESCLLVELFDIFENAIKDRIDKGGDSVRNECDNRDPSETDIHESD